MKSIFTHITAFIATCTLAFALSSNPVAVSAQDQNPAAPPAPAPKVKDTALPSQNPALNVPVVTNPNDSAFKIVVCDGPTLPPSQLAKLPNGGKDYVPCDFSGVMRQVQHLINIMMVLGVLVAILMFSYAGYLYMTGAKDKISHAHSIFQKTFVGFIIMLSAWFIVYQLLAWLTSNSGGFSTLLGSP